MAMVEGEELRLDQACSDSLDWALDWAASASAMALIICVVIIETLIIAERS